MAKTKTKAETIYGTVSRYKRGVTAVEVADKTGLNLATVRAYLAALAAEGSIQVCGTVQTGKRGRPANRYSL